MSIRLAATAFVALAGSGTAQAYQYTGNRTVVASGVGLIQASVPGGQMIVAHVHGVFRPLTSTGTVAIVRIAPKIPGQNLGDVVGLTLALDAIGNQLRATVSREIVAATGGIATIRYPVTDPLSSMPASSSGSSYNLDLWLYVTPTGAWIENVDGPSALSKAYVTPLFFGYADGAEAIVDGDYTITFPLTTQGGQQLNQVFQASPAQMTCHEPPCPPFQYFADILTSQFAEPTTRAPFFANGDARRAAALVATLGS